MGSSGTTITFWRCAAVICVCICCHSSRADTIHAPNRLEVNLGPLTIDVYNNTANFSSYYPSNACPPAGSGQKYSARGCFQRILAAFRAQGVTGVRFFFGLCGGANSTPLQNCGQSWSHVTGPNGTWLSNLNAFFDDLKANTFTCITPTPAHGDWVGVQGNAPSQYLSAAPAPSGQACTGTPLVLQYVPGEPYGRIPCHNTSPYNCTTWPTCTSCQSNVGFRVMPGDNNAYNCSPSNPIFVGWQNLYNVVNAVLSAAHAKGLTVAELDVEQELNPAMFSVVPPRRDLANHNEGYERSGVLLNCPSTAIPLTLQGFNPYDTFRMGTEYSCRRIPRVRGSARCTIS